MFLYFFNNKNNAAKRGARHIVRVVTLSRMEIAAITGAKEVEQDKRRIAKALSTAAKTTVTECINA